MLQGLSRDPNVKGIHSWTNILTMNKTKQLIFLHRVLLLHEISTKQGGRASVPRLSLAEWQSLADQCCFLGYCLEYMDEKLDHSGNRMFEQDLIDSLTSRVIEGNLALIE